MTANSIAMISSNRWTASIRRSPGTTMDAGGQERSKKNESLAGEIELAQFGDEGVGHLRVLADVGVGIAAEVACDLTRVLEETDLAVGFEGRDCISNVRARIAEVRAVHHRPERGEQKRVGVKVTKPRQ